MTNFHTEMQPAGVWASTDEPWQPISPPRRRASLAQQLAFHAYMLLAGLSVAFHAATLGRSRTSISTYREQAEQAARDNPAVRDKVDEYLMALRPEHGMQMAQRRGRAQLPYWSLLAICEFRDRGLSRREIAAAFRCSPGTVANALRWVGQGYNAMSGERLLTAAQQSPPGRRSPRQAS